jgi:hypothetical protein
VVSLVGRTALADLTGVLRSCVLYLGNNSGPQHIAAALGVPTVGIYSGVVDAAEWGPTGRHAIALQRNMICSPCYLVKPEDCVRDMACLKRLEPAVVHGYCEMLLARPVPEVAVVTRAKAAAEVAPKRNSVAGKAKPVAVAAVTATPDRSQRTRVGDTRKPAAEMVAKRIEPAGKKSGSLAEKRPTLQAAGSGVKVKLGAARVTGPAGRLATPSAPIQRETKTNLTKRRTSLGAKPTHPSLRLQKV